MFGIPDTLFRSGQVGLVLAPHATFAWAAVAAWQMDGKALHQAPGDSAGFGPVASAQEQV